MSALIYAIGMTIQIGLTHALVYFGAESTPLNAR
jgi:hypothetical protein